MNRDKGPELLDRPYPSRQPEPLPRQYPSNEREIETLFAELDFRQAQFQEKYDRLRVLLRECHEAARKLKERARQLSD